MIVVDDLQEYIFNLKRSRRNLIREIDYTFNPHIKVALQGAVNEIDSKLRVIESKVSQIILEVEKTTPAATEVVITVKRID